MLELLWQKDDDDFDDICDDNGKNIEEADKKTLFDYGFSKTGGTGIGLYHAKHLCNSNNGSIVYSDRPELELDKCFVITLPITKE